MSDKWMGRLPWIVAIIGAFVLGVGTGNWATRELLKQYQRDIQKASLSITGGTFCSTDGKTWWPARKDGMCYAVDEPR